MVHTCLSGSKLLVCNAIYSCELVFIPNPNLSTNCTAKNMYKVDNSSIKRHKEGNRQVVEKFSGFTSVILH